MEVSARSGNKLPDLVLYARQAIQKNGCRSFASNAILVLAWNGNYFNGDKNEEINPSW